MQGASPELSPISAIVLGLLAEHGPATSYDLKRAVDQSVGYFWSFPRSQLYAEPQRLVGLGLLSEEQESSGRRRRLYALTPAGRAALADWLDTPAGLGELRDPGLLRLFFAAQGSQAGLRALIAEQLQLHAERLADYQGYFSRMSDTERQHPSSYPLQMGLLYEQTCVQFWQSMEQQATE